MSLHVHSRPSGGLRLARGFSLVELMTVITLMSVIVLATSVVFKHSTQAGIRLESNDNLKNFGQLALNSIKQRMSQSRTIYQNDVYGKSLWARMTFAAGHTPISSATLPSIHETGSLSPSQAGVGSGSFDATSVGNALLFTEALGYADVAGRWIDLYRPCAYYLARSDSFSLAKKGYAYDLTEWLGNRYADYSQLVGADPAVAAALVAMGIDEAWNSAGIDAGSTVYTINANGTLTAQASPTLAPATTRSATHLFGSTGDTHYAVAFNSDTSFALPDTVPSFAIASSNGDGFPHGFETVIVGPTGGRKVLLRLVMVAEGYAGRYSSAVETVAAARNY